MFSSNKEDFFSFNDLRFEAKICPAFFTTIFRQMTKHDFYFYSKSFLQLLLCQVFDLLWLLFFKHEKTDHKKESITFFRVVCFPPFSVYFLGNCFSSSAPFEGKKSAK